MAMLTPDTCVVYPKDFANKDQAKAIHDALTGVVSDTTQIYASSSSIGTFFWAAPLTEESAKKVIVNENVKLS